MNLFESIDPKAIPQPKLHGLLLGAVAPRPIAFASTIDAEGRPNLAPFSFFNVFSSNPPICIFSPALRGRDATSKHTLDNVKVVPEVVINVVSFALVQQCSLASAEFDAGVNEFVKSGLTELKSEVVRPPRVMESPVQLECKVNEVVALGNQGGAGNLVICEVVRMHINKAVLTNEGRIDQQKIDLVARLGGDLYARASGAALFEVPKPGTGKVIGYDGLPDAIRNSSILTGNDLAMLANCEKMPDPSEVEADSNESKPANPSDSNAHHVAHNLLKNNKVNEAWKVLLS